MLVVIYEGNPGDPMDQTMRVVRASSTAEARELYPRAFLVQEYQEPSLQDPPDLKRLERGMAVWSY